MLSYGGTSCPAVWGGSWDVPAELRVLEPSPERCLAGSDCQSAFSSGCLETYFKYVFLGGLRCAWDKAEGVWVIDVLSKHGGWSL